MWATKCVLGVITLYALVIGDNTAVADSNSRVHWQRLLKDGHRRNARSLGMASWGRIDQDHHGHHGSSPPGGHHHSPPRDRHHHSERQIWDGLGVDFSFPLFPSRYGRRNISFGPLSFNLGSNFRVNLFNTRRNWWEGPNVHKENLEEKDEDDSVEITNHAIVTSTTCTETEHVYKCITKTSVLGMRVTLVTTYRCKHGFTRITGDFGCPKEVNLMMLGKTLKNLGLNKMIAMVNAVGIGDLLETSNLTIFAPSDPGFETFEEQQMMDKNEVLLLPDGGADSYINDITDQVSAHLVDGFKTTSIVQDEQILNTANPGTSIRINIYDEPEKVVTANCVRVTSSDNLATNGVVHIVDKLLPRVTQSIYDIIAEDARFNILKSALNKTGLTGLLDGEGQFTIFAPTDTAFLKANKSYGSDLVASGCLVNLLKSHVLPNVICSVIMKGKVKSKNIVDKFLVLTQDQRQLTVEGINISVTDVMATNGVIHVIDDVIIPQEARTLPQTMADVGASKALELFEKAGLLASLVTDDNITVFVPTNEAFQKLPEEVQAHLDSDPQLLLDVLRYHIVPRRVTSNRFRHSQNLPTLSGTHRLEIRQFSTLASTFSIGDPVTVVQCSPLGRKDMQGCNGVVHLIDQVLMPPAGDVMVVLQKHRHFDELVSLIQAADLVQFVNSQPSLTIFAPTNTALQKLNSTVQQKLSSDQNFLRMFLKNHMIDSVLCCNGVQPSARYTSERTLGGRSLWLTRDASELFVNNVSVKACDRSDMLAVNGVVYAIDTIIADKNPIDKDLPSKLPWDWPGLLEMFDLDWP